MVNVNTESLVWLDQKLPFRRRSGARGQPSGRAVEPGSAAHAVAEFGECPHLVCRRGVAFAQRRVGIKDTFLADPAVGVGQRLAECQQPRDRGREQVAPGLLVTPRHRLEEGERKIAGWSFAGIERDPTGDCVGSEGVAPAARLRRGKFRPTMQRRNS